MGAAAICVLTHFLVTWLWAPALAQHAPFALAVFGALLATWFVGWKSGLLVILSSLAGGYLLTPSVDEFKTQGTRFLTMCTIMVLVVEILARDRLAKEQALGAVRRSDMRKSRFLSVLSHELRNPLAALGTGVELLKRQARGPTEAATVQAFERQIKHMKRLVDDLLEVARIDQGKIGLQWTQVPIESLTSDAVAMSMTLTSAKKQMVQVSLPSPAPVMRVDATRITQVLCNLIHNAAKFSPAGAKIELTARQDAGSLVFMVKDYGKGIPADQLEQIFSTFVQLDEQDHAQTGLGLGLSVVRRLVVLHGGTVKAHSDGMGCGAQFEVRLPPDCVVAQPANVTGSDGEPTAASVNELVLTILVVDDHQDVANTVAALLKMDGHRVTTAGNGKDALNAAAVHMPDLVILDMSLPDMNGKEVAQNLRQNASGAEPKIIAMSGWSPEPAGPDDAAFEAYLVKPVSYDTLNRTIGEIRFAQKSPMKT